jgi:hypothetical protein
MSNLLTDETRKFVTSGASITLASRNPQYIPSVARAKGCTLNGEKLRIFVSAAQAAEVLDDVRTSRMISATFSVPRTHRTLQFKGKDATVVPIAAAERAFIAQYVEQFSKSIAHYGFTAEFTHAFFASQDDEVAIEFTPTEGFEQTPGPSAGARLA